MENINFCYPNSTSLILKNLSLSIPFGIHFGISGGSGTGKTTLLNLLSRVWDPESGQILLGGQNLRNFSEHDLRNYVSFVTQKVRIFNASVRDNLTLMQNNITNEKLIEVLALTELDKFILSLPQGLNTAMGEFGKEFSGGQIRRIAIARALLKNTPILLLDEPSTGLNDELMQGIWKNCESIFKNKTVIVATHDKKVLMLLDTVLHLQPDFGPK